MIYGLCIILSLAAGYFYRDLRDSIKALQAKQEPLPDVGVTPGSYHPIDIPKTNQDGEVGLVEPKTPQQLEWQEQERLRELQLNVKVKPR